MCAVMLCLDAAHAALAKPLQDFLNMIGGKYSYALVPERGNIHITCLYTSAVPSRSDGCYTWHADSV